MISFSKPFFLGKCISVKAAADYCGYNQQYLRRLLRRKKLAGLKLGQLWLIEMESFSEYLVLAGTSKDHRFGPKYFFSPQMYTPI